MPKLYEEPAGNWNRERFTDTQTGERIERYVPRVEGAFVQIDPRPAWAGVLVRRALRREVQPRPDCAHHAARLAKGLCQVEANNTILNLLAKARGPYLSQIITLFTDHNVPFSRDSDWCSFLYLNGIIDEAPEGLRCVCRFSSPFVQRRLFAALTNDMFGDKGPILAIEPIDTLSDVLTPGGLCLPPLLERYRGYLNEAAQGAGDRSVEGPASDLLTSPAMRPVFAAKAVGKRSTAP